MNLVLRTLFDTATEVPTVFVNEAGTRVVASYGPSGIELEIVVLEQALGLSAKAGQPHRLIAPSVQEAMDFLIEVEGHRQRTNTPLIRLPNRHAKLSGRSVGTC